MGAMGVVPVERPLAVAVRVAQPGERESSLRAQLLALLVLNLLDALFTMTFLHMRVAEEANPLMRAAYAGSPLLFLVLKLFLVHTGATLLWVNRAAAAARVALASGVGLYAAIVVYHCSFAARLAAGAFH
ncbi:MAG TPA: DUF5658 family protein [Myxococcales bacterium]|jgi:hypothetical protein|nr:DUF5658 family protein [Myxococcales bacterium]